MPPKTVGAPFEKTNFSSDPRAEDSRKQSDSPVEPSKRALWPLLAYRTDPETQKCARDHKNAPAPPLSRNTCLGSPQLRPPPAADPSRLPNVVIPSETPPASTPPETPAAAHPGRMAVAIFLNAPRSVSGGQVGLQSEVNWSFYWAAIRRMGPLLAGLPIPDPMRRPSDDPSFADKGARGPSRRAGKDAAPIPPSGFERSGISPPHRTHSAHLSHACSIVTIA